MIDVKDYPNRNIDRKTLPPADAIDRRLVTVNLDESPLGWLASRGMISVRQMEAGERLREDYYRSGLSSRVTMRWDPAPSAAHRGDSGGAAMQTLGAIDAKRRFDAAIAEVGPGLSDILWRVVCAGEGLTAAEKGLKWPARAAKLVLGMALDRLASYYKIQNG